MKTLHQLVATTVAALAVSTLMGFASAPAMAAPVVVDVTGAKSVNLLGESGNTVWFIDVGANAMLNSLSWSVDLEAYAPSLLSEMQLSFGGSSGLDLVSFAPGDGDFASGVGGYSGSLDLSGLGLAVGADGLLRLEFSDAYKDFANGVAEGQWLGGTLTFDVGAASAVPEPASAALALLGLAVLAARRGAASKSTGQSSWTFVDRPDDVAA